MIAAEVTIDSPGFGEVGPMVAATERELQAGGVADAPEVVLANAGYWHEAQMEDIVTRGIQALVPPDANKRKGAGPDGTAASTRSCATCLATELGAGLYGKCRVMIESVFGDGELQPPGRPLPAPREIGVRLGVTPDRSHA